ncbi:hypothetical protein VNO78_23267 [Psophocarpus tetragonolobus]|uniref:Uncharacterized protein n=1 Tax=Psophocarpus tetragonolobus TaxID=3891 RepID=A0AAN9S4L9_PSOTE
MVWCCLSETTKEFSAIADGGDAVETAWSKIRLRDKKWQTKSMEGGGWKRNFRLQNCFDASFVFIFILFFFPYVDNMFFLLF